jgi:response regulator RpfG family c-di-GMP phosphodiesterase
MDLRMQDLDGLQATRKILSNPTTSSIPIIMVTASAFGDSRQAALDAGCVDFISKPIRAEQLFQKLQRHSGVRFVAANDEDRNEDELLVFSDSSRRELGRRLEEAASIGNIAELDAIVVELAKGTPQDVTLGGRIARLSSKFDFAALLQLAGLMQARQENSRAAT